MNQKGETGTELVEAPEMALVKDPGRVVEDARRAAAEMMALVEKRKEPVIIKGKRYLEFRDWQLLGMFFGITAKVTQIEEINIIQDDRLKFLGFKATANTIRNDQIISTAIMECTRLEPNWKDKPRFQIESMAQTRACAKALRNVLGWVLTASEAEDIGQVSAEEVTGEGEQLDF